MHASNGAPRWVHLVVIVPIQRRFDRNDATSIGSRQPRRRPGVNPHVSVDWVICTLEEVAHTCCWMCKSQWIGGAPRASVPGWSHINTSAGEITASRFGHCWP